MNNTECIICDEPRADLDDEGICPDCHDQNCDDTDADLARAGIDPTDHPIVIEAEIIRRTLG